MEKTPQQENVDKEPKVVITSRGSRYTYLPNGKTQRFKAVTGETFEPMDILLFIPPLSEIPDSVKNLYPHIFIPSLTERDFGQICLSYKPIVPVFRDGTEVNSLSEIEKGDEVFLYFIKNNKPDFHIPVSYRPSIGYSTYDRIVRVSEDGKRLHQQHLGHPVIDIEY
jgi:hypothetical protein